MSGRGIPAACDGCLRRAWLIGSLSGYIENAIADSPGSRARELLALPDAELAKALAGSKAAEFLKRAGERDPGRLRAAARGAGVWASCRHDDIYPRTLRRLGDAPATLFGRGDPCGLELLEGGSVTMVGARRPTGYAREMARLLGAELAAAGLTVVSGMALGIDSCAHQGALRAGGFTAAVLGSGADLPYPATLRALYEEIVERGLVLSELPPGTAARKWTFPARNRIMAALGTMTVVVEARQRSGSLITSGMASEMGREVGAVPGRVGTAAAGTNDLLRDGAHVIRSAQDVLDTMVGPGEGGRRRTIRRARPPLEKSLAAVLACVERDVAGSDAVARETGLAPAEVAVALTKLELLGYVRSDSAGRYEPTPRL